MRNIAAGIVLYNPDLNILKENIDSIYKQVEYVVLIDNNSNNIEEIINLSNSYKNIEIVRNKKNLGVATALNQIIKICDKREIKWVLTLDQDSVCPENIIDEYIKYIDIEKIAIITLQIVDRNNKFEFKKSNKFEFVDMCITSASLTNVDICKRVGLFDENLFIDYVDFEYCIRLKRNGYKILKVNSIALLHRLGNMKIYKLFGKSIHVTNHNNIRNYYIIRNMIYTYRKHKDLIKFTNIFTGVIIAIFKISIYENKKILKLKSILKGIIDGVKMEVYI